MKFNWGHGIALFFSFFVIMTVWQVIKSAGEDHTLVKDDYYVDDLQLEKLMEKKLNQKNLKNFNFTYDESKKTVTISFPKEMTPEGKIQFYCPASSLGDKSIDIKPNSENQIIYDTKDLRKGKYKVIVDWKDGEKSYYVEENIYVG